MQAVDNNEGIVYIGGMNNKNKVAFVTGASSGIGQAVAAAMAGEGYIVYGTSRFANYETAGAPGALYTMLPMTLEDESSIAAAVDYIARRHGRLDVVVNAAGSGIAGAIEETTAHEARAQFDVCFFGVISVYGCVLPLMRAAGGGTVINIGSMASSFPIPFQSMYCASKAALLSMSATLRLEAGPFGIKVCTIEPGDTHTGFKRAFTEKTRQTVYRKPLERALYEMIRSEMAAQGPERCAKLVLKAVKMKNPPVRLSVGLCNKLFYLAAKIAPRWLNALTMRMIYLKKDPPENAVWTYDKQFKEE